jgi:acetoin utilization deacetylase AcuC-like enzyme
MLVLHSPASLRHDPDAYFRRGRTVEHPEQARRYSILHDAVVEAGHALREAEDHGLASLAAVHDRGYLDFLSGIWSRRSELPGIGEEVLTGHYARPQMMRRPEGLLGQLGYYMADTSTPVRAGTWEAVYGSAQVALEGVRVAINRRTAYALCRPPGHHAYAASAGGFCFLNNTAIAAQAFRGGMGGRIAVLDIDVHHGNGTQGIFWERPDVLTVSVHANPSNYFPFYTGYADETGGGEGAGANRNIVLPEGSKDQAWLGAIDDGMAAVEAFRPAALVVALGFDASEDDPIGAFKVTTAGFSRAAERIAKFAGPVLLVQEGGYLCKALPRNLVAFLAAFEAKRG